MPVLDDAGEADEGAGEEDGCAFGLEAVITAWLFDGDVLGCEVCKVTTGVSFLVALELPGLRKISATTPMINSDTSMAGQGLPFDSWA